MNPRDLFAFAVVAALITGVRAGEIDAGLEKIDALLASREYEAARSSARSLLEETRAQLGEDGLPVGQLVDRLVDARLGLRMVDEECLALARRAVDIKERHAGPEEPETAQSLRRLALVLQSLQRPAEARAPMERAAAIQEAHFGKGSGEAIEVVARLAYLYGELGLEREAAELLEETLVFGDVADQDPRAIAPLLYNLAVMKTALGEFEGAEHHYRRLLEITPEDAGYERSVAWNGLGMIYIEEARYIEAQDALDQAIAAARQAGASPTMVAYYMNNMAFLLKEIGDYEEAIPLYEETLEIRRSSDGEVHLNTAATLANLAEAHFLNGDLERARTLHEQALAIHERVSDDATIATSLQKLADVHLAAHRADEALALLRRALEIRSQHLGPEHYDTGKVRIQLAHAQLASGDATSAEAGYRHALSTLRPALGPEHPDVVESTLGLARSLAARDAFDEAWALALEAETHAREHTELTAAALPERMALRYASVTKRSLDLLLSLTDRVPSPDAVAVAWDRVIRSRALVLDLMAARRADLGPQADPEAKRLAESYRATSRDLASLVLGTGDGGKGDPGERIRKARGERERIERELAKRSARFSRRLARREVGLAAVRAALPEQATLIGYVRYVDADLASTGRREERYAAFVLTPGLDTPRWIPLGDAAEVDQAVIAWRSEVVADLHDEGALARCRERGEALRSALWDPVAPEDGASGGVFVVPDGNVHRVSFYALPTGPSSYLVEAGPLVHYLSAERDLVHASDAPDRIGNGLLAVGGVDFGAPEGATKGPLSAVEFRALPATVDEVRSIADLWREGSGSESSPIVLTGSEAAEGTVKRRIGGRRIVHLATHGFFLGDAPRGLTPGTRAIGGLSPARPAVRESALSLSGLALAGANRHGAGDQQEDGVLLAEEIAALDLAGTEWVVLSACDTGLGDLQTGEGVLGLRRAFEVAGAETLVMSLWEVDDEATRRWMDALYVSRFEKRKSTMASVRDACTTVLAWSRERGSTDHPFYWGAFVAAGNWR